MATEEKSAANVTHCPFCRESINAEAMKCPHCHSILIKGEGPSPSTHEKIAELVIKSVGVIPILMGLLLVIAGIFGVKTLGDVQEFAKRAEVASQSIEAQKKTIHKLLIAEIGRSLDSLLNDLRIDSASPKALRTRQELKEMVTTLEQHEPGEAGKGSRGVLARALFAYYEKRYDDGLALLKQADHEVNKFRLLGIITSRKAEKTGNAAEAKKFYEEADRYFETAEKMAEKESRRLLKNRANRAASKAKLGQHIEAEKMFLDLIAKEPDELLHYYNMSAMYSLGGQLGKALDSLEKGVTLGLAASGDLTRKDLDTDPDFNNLLLSKEPEIQRRLGELRKKLP